MCYPSYIFPFRKKLRLASQWIMNLCFMRENTIMWYLKKLGELKSVFYLLKCIPWNISHGYTHTQKHWSLWENSKGPVFYYRKIESETSFIIQYGQI